MTWFMVHENAAKKPPNFVWNKKLETYHPQKGFQFVSLKPRTTLSVLRSREALQNPTPPSLRIAMPLKTLRLRLIAERSFASFASNSRFSHPHNTDACVSRGSRFCLTFACKLVNQPVDMWHRLISPRCKTVSMGQIESPPMK